ncbi:MAG: hypothetical protein ABJC79_02865, partial [Acidimicrobiia bacterium]
MATALECPACGHRHRLDAVGDRSVFPCAKCSRQLKTPSQIRPGGTRAGALRAAGVAPASGRSVSAGRRVRGGQIRMPVKILIWVVAFLLGALVVRVLAKLTGFVDTNTFVDLMLDHSFSTYWRLLVIVPVWALFATVFATAFLEGPGWWARRTSGAPARPARTRVPAGAVATTGAAARRVPQRTTASPPRTPTRAETRPASPPAATKAAAAAARPEPRRAPPNAGDS